jgi:1-acyl-sn-glycerol-3-phosphate acyltransferase
LHGLVAMTFAVGETARERWLRRLVTGPALLATTLLYLALSPVLIAAAALADLVARQRWRATRFAIAVGATLVMHVVGLTGVAATWFVGGRWAGADAGRERRLEQRLQVWWAKTMWWAAARLYRLRLEIEGEDAVEPGPLLVLSRHTSLIDTLIPMVVLAARRGIRLRYVMKRELLWDPCLDAFGHRWPTAFVRRGTGDRREIAHVLALLEGLGARDAIVMFPEGTRFSAEKQARIRSSLQRRHPDEYERALRLRHVLPPHAGGPLALLAAAPRLDVVFCAHTGLEGACHLLDLMSGALLGRTVRVQLRRVDRDQIPAERAAQLAWLADQWAQVDRWVGAHARDDRS